MSTNKCQLCSKLGASESPNYSTLDHRKTHTQFHLFQLGYIGDDNIALRRVFEQCFLTTEMFVNHKTEVANNGNNEEEKGEKSRWTLLELCRTFIKNRKDSTSMFCHECKSNVQYVQLHSKNGCSYLDAKSLLNHVISHSAMKPYHQCPCCEYGSATKHNVTRHVKETHASSDGTVEVRDATEYWSANFDEIVNSLGKCFDGFDPNFAAVKRSAMRKQQTLKCSELLKKYANKEKKLHCIPCRKWISTGAGAMDLLCHVRTHSSTPLFKCKKCSATFETRGGVRKHLFCRHKDSSTKDIEDKSDEYHEQLMELVTKCFDKESNA